MKIGAKHDPPASTVGVFFAPNFIQNLYTVLKKRLWESRSTPTLGILNFADPKIHKANCICPPQQTVIRLFLKPLQNW
jgi:hypothetical protein